MLHSLQTFCLCTKNLFWPSVEALAVMLLHGVDEKISISIAVYREGYHGCYRNVFFSFSSLFTATLLGYFGTSSIHQLLRPICIYFLCFYSSIKISSTFNFYRAPQTATISKLRLWKLSSITFLNTWTFSDINSASPIQSLPSNLNRLPNLSWRLVSFVKDCIRSMGIMIDRLYLCGRPFPSEAFAQHHVLVGYVYSNSWCRREY